MDKAYIADRSLADKSDDMYASAIELAREKDLYPVTKYMGKKAFKMICSSAPMGSIRFQEELVALFTVAGFRDVVIQMFKARILRLAAVIPLSKPSIYHSLPIYEVCASHLNLDGYASLFDRKSPTVDATPLDASAEMITQRYRDTFPGTLEFRLYGTEDIRGTHWKGNPNSTIYTYLDEIIRFSNLWKYYPANTNVDWGPREYQRAILSNLRVMRSNFGLPPALPDFPTSEETFMPEQFDLLDQKAHPSA